MARTMSQGLVMMALRPFWRMRRGLTLGVQGVVSDGDGGVLLVRHGYRPGWHFPGGGVEWGESTGTAIGRELLEETGVIADQPPRLFGLYNNIRAFPGDHVALFVVEQWRRPGIPASNAEIRESRFFPRTHLPAETSPAVHRRLAEIDGRNSISPDW